MSRPSLLQTAPLMSSSPAVFDSKLEICSSGGKAYLLGVDIVEHTARPNETSTVVCLA